MERPATVLNSLMTITRAGGALGIPGLYATDDPGGVDDAAKTGNLSIRIGLGWAKSHAFTTGQCPVMRYHRQLMQAILHDKTQIAKAVNVEVISLDQAAEGYRDFDRGAAKKFVIDPHHMAVKAASRVLNAPGKPVLTPYASPPTRRRNALPRASALCRNRRQSNRPAGAVTGPGAPLRLSLGHSPANESST